MLHFHICSSSGLCAHVEGIVVEGCLSVIFFGYYMESCAVLVFSEFGSLVFKTLNNSSQFISLVFLNFDTAMLECME